MPSDQAYSTNIPFPEEDVSDGMETTASVLTGQGYFGAIDFPYDYDWISTFLIAGRVYQIDLFGEAHNDLLALSDTVLRGVYDDTGQLLLNSSDDDGGEGRNSRLGLQVDDDGYYFIEVSGFASVAGGYTVTVNDLTVQDEFTASQRGYLSEGRPVEGELSYVGDVDYFDVYLDVGQRHAITLDGPSLSTLQLRLSDRDGDLTTVVTQTQLGDDAFELEVLESGLYTFEISLPDAHYGAYTVSLSVEDGETTDAIPEDSTSQSVINVGTVFQGRIDFATDIDWIGLETRAGHRYDVVLSDGNGDWSLSDPVIHGIYTSIGDLIEGTYNDDSDGAQSKSSFVATESGRYFIAASGFMNDTGYYDINVEDLGVDDDYSADIQTSARVTRFLPVEGHINFQGDQDWVRVSLEAGNRYSFHLMGADHALHSDVIIDGLFDAAGDVVSLNTESGFGFNTTASGDYFISVSSDLTGSAGYELGFDVETLFDANSGDDFSEDAFSEGTVIVGGPARGIIEAQGDKDWFKVSLVAGETYDIQICGAASEMGTLEDPFLEGVYDASGDFVLGSNVDDGATGLDSAFVFSPFLSGDYFISASGFSNHVGSYHVVVNVSEASTDYSRSDDIGHTPDTAGSLDLGGFIQGEIETQGDVDWFKITLTAGATYRFELMGAPSQNGTLTDPYIHGLFSGAGIFIDGTANDDVVGSLNSAVTFTAETTGTYFLAAGGFSDALGTYKLTSQQLDIGVAVDDWGLWSEGGAIELTSDEAGGQTGRIEFANDVDHFTITVDAGQSYRITQTALDGGGLNDTVLQGVFSDDGLRLHEGDDDSGHGLNSQLTFTADYSGTVFIAASAYGDQTGHYRIDVAAYDLTAPPTTSGNGPIAEAVVSVGGTYQGEIEFVDDSDLVAVYLIAGREYQIDVEGVDSGLGTLEDPSIAGLQTASGDMIVHTNNDDGGNGLNARLRFSPDISGTYYINSGAYDGTGTYTLRVEDITPTTDPSTSQSVNGQFDIDINYSGDESFRSYFEQAAEFWEGIILGDLPDINGIDDLRIDVSITDIDGISGILGQAGATQWRDNKLPYLGIMRFDSADIADLERDGRLLSVVQHEMGHVLGISNLIWSSMGLVQNDLFIGDLATEVYSSWTGTEEAGVPIEQDHGPGTAGSHWDEDIFDSELMTGFAERNGDMPISELTIAALADMNYQVNFEASEQYEFEGVYVPLVGYTLPSDVQIITVNYGSGYINPPSLDEFMGNALYNYQDKSIWMDQDIAGRKIDGLIETLGGTDVWFFETTTGQDLLVHLVGDFEKHDAELASDIKGTVQSLTIFSDGDIIQTRHFADDGLSVDDVLSNWQGLSVDDNNYIHVSDAFEHNDYIDSGAGDDVVLTGRGFDQIIGGQGNDTLIAGLGDDIVIDSWGDDQLRGDDGSDQLYAYTGDNILDGGSGNDTLAGGIGDDTLVGGSGNDVLIGDITGQSRLSDDRLIAGEGDDLLQGGLDADVFVFAPNQGQNHIAKLEQQDDVYAAVGQDFNVSVDKLELELFGYASMSQVLANFSMIDGHAVFDDQGTQITLYDVSLASLTDENFILEA